MKDSSSLGLSSAASGDFERKGKRLFRSKSLDIADERLPKRQSFLKQREPVQSTSIGSPITREEEASEPMIRNVGGGVPESALAAMPVYVGSASEKKTFQSQEQNVGRTGPIGQARDQAIELRCFADIVSQPPERMTSSQVKPSKSTGYFQDIAEPLTRKLNEVHTLSQRVHMLLEEQRKHALTSERLEQRIKQGELGYADMLRRSLALSQALEKRRQDINEDKVQWETEKASVTMKSREVHEIMAQITSLTAGSENNPATNFIKDEPQ